MTQSFLKVDTDNLVWSKRERKKPVALVPGAEKPEKLKPAPPAEPGENGALAPSSACDASLEAPAGGATAAVATCNDSQAAGSTTDSTAATASASSSSGRGASASRGVSSCQSSSASLQSAPTVREIAAEEPANSGSSSQKRARGSARPSCASRSGSARSAHPSTASMSSLWAGGERHDEDDQRANGSESQRSSRAPASQRRRESEAQKWEVMAGLEPVQQLLMLGSVPEMADQHVWNGFATVRNGDVQIRASRVEKIIGENAVGRGLFAMRDFAINEMITVYGGELITVEEAHQRKNKHGAQSHRYLMRISDSDFLVDGWHYASGISEKPGKGGIFLPADKNATQYSQGCAAMANHDTGNAANATVSFVPLARAEAFMLYPRVPTLRANRHVAKGEEIRFNYGSALPFCPQAATEQDMEAEVEEEELEGWELSQYWPDIEWTAQGVDAGHVRVALTDLSEVTQERGKHKEHYEAAARLFKLFSPIKRAAPQHKETARLLALLKEHLGRLLKSIGGHIAKEKTKREGEPAAEPAAALAPAFEPAFQSSRRLSACPCRRAHCRLARYLVHCQVI